VPRITREIVINAPPEAVFDALTDPKRRREWLTTMDESPPDGPLMAGSRVPAKRRATGSTSTYELEVTALDAPRRLETLVRRNGADAGAGGFKLTPEAGDRTRVSGFASFKLPFVQRVLTPVVTANVEKGLVADLTALKRHVEDTR
jgi:uncharacterized protein YndB with AHSA1/START domain